MMLVAGTESSWLGSQCNCLVPSGSLNYVSPLQKAGVDAALTTSVELVPLSIVPFPLLACKPFVVAE